MKMLLRSLMFFSLAMGVSFAIPLEAKKKSKKKRTQYVQEEKGNYIEGQSVLVKIPFLGNYGHSLLDGAFPLYMFLSENGLLATGINLFIICGDTDKTINNASWQNAVDLLKDLYNIKSLNIVRQKDVKGISASKLTTEQVEYKFERLTIVPYEHFYSVMPSALNYLNQLKKLGFKETFLIRDSSITNNALTDFISYVLDIYEIDRKMYPMIKNRVLLSRRSASPRVILNADELASSLQEDGYDVQEVYFETISLREQIIQTMQAEYLIGATGSNMVNAIFLPPDSVAVEIFGKDMRYALWNGDEVTSSIISCGTQLIEYEKPEYDQRDHYLSLGKIERPQFYIVDGNVIELNPSKINDTDLKNLSPANELLNVDFYVDPEDVIEAMQQPIPVDFSLKW